MPQQLLSQEDLRKKAQAMLMESPVLAKLPEVLSDLLTIVSNLSEEDLKELLTLLSDEATDWKKYLDELSVEREKIVTEANNSSLHLQKEAEKLLQGAEEEISEAEDSTRAEDLLKQL